jgi:hypothetical protein
LEAEGRERTPRLVKWAVHVTRKAKVHEAPEALYGRWRAETAERGTDPDRLVRRITGRARDWEAAVSDAAVARVFDRLAGPEGLTAQASTFAREDVITALGAGLVGASRSELDALADRFLSGRAVSVVADRALEERRWSTPELLGVEERLVTAAVDRTSEQTGVVSHEAVRSALSPIRRSAPTRPAWSATSAWTAPVSRSWSAARGRARRSPWARHGMPGSSIATGCWPPPPPESQP